MAINLASKYSDQIAEVFTRSSFIKGKTAETFDLTGVKTLKVYTPITVEEVDYDRDGGLGRYGAVTEMQDVVQELTMTQDKAFTLTIDKGNNLDQNLVKNAADMLRLQLSEKSTPSADKYAFKRFVTMAGTIAESEKPTRADIISKIADARAHPRRRTRPRCTRACTSRWSGTDSGCRPARARHRAPAMHPQSC